MSNLFFLKPHLWFGIQTFCSEYFHSLLLSAFLLLAIQPLTQTRRFLILMRAFSTSSKSINARTPKAFFCQGTPFWIAWCKHHRMTTTTADQILHLMLHEMLQPCSDVEWRMLRAILHCVSGPLVYLQFWVDFWRIHAIEVNSWAVWSKRDKKFKGKLIICCRKQELARTCSVNINAEDNHSNLWPCDWRDCCLLLCLSFTHSTNKLNLGFCNVGMKAVYWKQY